MQSMVASIYCALVIPNPQFDADGHLFNSFAARVWDPAMNEYFARASSNNNVSNRCFSTLRTSEVSPTLAIAQTLPLTNPSTSVGGSSTHWHSSWDSKPCWAWRHSFTLTISSSCSLVAFLSKVFDGALQKMATQGCCFNARLATTNCPEILLFCIRAQTGWETRSQYWMSWILQVALPPTSCTAVWYLAATDRLQQGWSYGAAYCVLFPTPQPITQCSCRSCMTFICFSTSIWTFICSLSV